MKRRYLARRKMRWAVRFLVELGPRGRFALRNRLDSNRAAEVLDRAIANMYTSAKFSAYPKMVGYDGHSHR